MNTSIVGEASILRLVFYLIPEASGVQLNLLKYQIMFTRCLHYLCNINTEHCEVQYIKKSVPRTTCSLFQSITIYRT